jgi:hypothetical protein
MTCPLPASGRIRDGIVSLDVSKVADVIRVLTLSFPSQPADVKTFSLTAPHRFIIDAYRPLSTRPQPFRPSKRRAEPDIRP